jgi:hypothetical protein
LGTLPTNTQYLIVQGEQEAFHVLNYNK